MLNARTKRTEWDSCVHSNRAHARSANEFILYRYSIRMSTTGSERSLAGAALPSTHCKWWLMLLSAVPSEVRPSEVTFYGPALLCSIACSEKYMCRGGCAPTDRVLWTLACSLEYSCKQALSRADCAPVKLHFAALLDCTSRLRTCVRTSESCTQLGRRCTRSLHEALRCVLL